MLDAVKNPKKVVEGTNGAIKYQGKKATVVLNSEGKVITTFGKSRGPQIWQQGTTRASGGGSAQRRANEAGFSYNPQCNQVAKMHFKINHSDVILLTNALGDSEIALKFINIEEHIENGKHPTGRYVVDLSNNEAGLVVELLSDSLMNSGFDENGEPNSVGRQMEMLIDTFNVTTHSPYSDFPAKAI